MSNVICLCNIFAQSNVIDKVLKLFLFLLAWTLEFKFDPHCICLYHSPNVWLTGISSWVLKELSVLNKHSTTELDSIPESVFSLVWLKRYWDLLKKKSRSFSSVEEEEASLVFKHELISHAAKILSKGTWVTVHCVSSDWTSEDLEVSLMHNEKMTTDFPLNNCNAWCLAYYADLYVQNFPQVITHYLISRYRLTNRIKTFEYIWNPWKPRLIVITNYSQRHKCHFQHLILTKLGNIKSLIMHQSLLNENIL